MKYFTKEWYKACQKTDLHLLLEPLQEAKHHSEELFLELYKQKENEWVELQKSVSEVNVEEVASKVLRALIFETTELDPLELEEAEREYAQAMEAVRIEAMNRPPFDCEKEKKRFNQLYKSKLQNILYKLPEDILSMIADIRVLALDFATDEIIAKIKEYCEMNKGIVHSTISDYRNYYKNEFSGEELTKTDKISFHDSKVISCRKSGNDIVLVLDNSNGYTNAETVVFKDCTVIQQESRLYGAEFLNEEVYKIEGGYEIHFLLERNNRLIEYTITATDVQLS